MNLRWLTPAFLPLLLLAIVPLPTCMGFGAEGHQIVGAIADQLVVGTPAEAKIKELLKNESLSTVSTWADKIKNGNSPSPALNAFRDSHRAFPEGFKTAEHKLFHYTDIPFQESAYFPTSKGAHDRDIVHAMENCIAVLQGTPPPLASFQDLTPEVALILLVHFVGDIHQPLHVGSGYLDENNQFVNANENPNAQSDHGGNSLIFSKNARLHSYWDTAVVKGVMRKADFKEHPIEYAHFLVKNAPVVGTPMGLPTTWPAKWATETLPLAKQAHEGIKVTGKNADGDWTIELPEGYMDRSETIISDQLTKGGYHLAQLLQEIWH